MSLSLRQKQTFYHELAQFLRTGIPMPQAVEALTPDTPRGAMRDVLERLRELFRQKETVQGAFAKLPPAISDMEVTLIDAASTSGRLDQACLFLAAYFESLAGMRAGTIKQITWPLVQLHFGVLILGVPKVFAGGSISDYLAQSLGTLAVFYGAAIAVGLAVAALLRLASRNAGVDRVLRGIPVVGALRRNLSLSRFCAVYEMQLQAAINIMDALRSAAKASQSALTASEIERIIPQVRDGAQVGSQLAGSPAFPAASPARHPDRRGHWQPRRGSAQVERILPKCRRGEPGDYWELAAARDLCDHRGVSRLRDHHGLRTGLHKTGSGHAQSIGSPGARFRHVEERCRRGEHQVPRQRQRRAGRRARRAGAAKTGAVDLQAARASRDNRRHEDQQRDRRAKRRRSAPASLR